MFSSQQKVQRVFIDLEKAYDCVLLGKNFGTAYERKVRTKRNSDKDFRLVQDMCEGSKIQVGCTPRTCDILDITVGVHQGSDLAPYYSPSLWIDLYIV